MAVYTNLTGADLERAARAFGLGRVISHRFVPEGSINTNVRLDTESGRFFLRHTTVRTAEDLFFEAAVLEHLSAARFPSPTLVRAHEEPFLPLAGGRVSVFHYLVGEELSRPKLTPEHLERLGQELAKMHLALNSFLPDRPNPYGPTVVRGWLAELERRPEPELSGVGAVLRSALERSQAGEGLLPRGIIHADLFMDNVKWVGDRVSAFFDFEMVCRDVLSLDLAITLNAWCFEGEYQEPLCRALVRGYQLERRLEPIERERLFHQALFGALRFTASRIRDFHLSTLPPERLARKDFRTYLARVRALSAMGPEGFRASCGLGR
ncbi:MAG: homoserine kinase [Myxococcales bacterium]|nr:homoserine kinase [Myxococcales bacterium]